MSVTVRYNDDMSVDEVVAQKATVHLEQMSGNQWSLIIDTGKSRSQFMLVSRGKIETKITELNMRVAP